MVLHQKDRIWAVLEEFLFIRDKACVLPLVDLVAALARDLREEVYPLLPKMLECLAPLTESKEVAIVESVFATLWQLLKIFSKRVVIEFEQTFTFVPSVNSESKVLF